MLNKHLLTNILCNVGLSFVLVSGFFHPVAARTFNKTDIVGPAGSVRFGENVTVLANGNFVIVDSGYTPQGSSSALGAVYLYNGVTLQMISALIGILPFESGSGGSKVVPLPNGNYVIVNPWWNNGAVNNAGAITWCSGTIGCDNEITTDNSLIGDHRGDLLGFNGITILSDGDYVVLSPGWSNGDISGALTWCSGSSGCQGNISPANSLVGVSLSSVDFVKTLSNGNYLVRNPYWRNGTITNAGAVRWCSGSGGCTGYITAENSLVGSHQDDKIGNLYWDGNGLLELSNGNYIVVSTYWDNDTRTNSGAVTWCSGVSGCAGVVSSDDSVIGSTSGDLIEAYVLTNGNYVVGGNDWDNGAIVDAGAARLCSGAGGCTGPLTPSNSLVGSHHGDNAGIVTALENGNYVVKTYEWNNGSTPRVGAVTWCNGTTGCVGPVTESNSLIGSHTNDFVDASRVIPLSDGDYILAVPYWDNGTTTDVGAVTWCSGTSGCVGVISGDNSLIGSHAGDSLGYLNGFRINILSNGSYVVGSPQWDNGSIVDAGAVTWCSGSGSCHGPVATSNSLVGTHPGDNVGYSWIYALPNGNYLVQSEYWNSHAVALTWCNGTTGCIGEVSTMNSLVGYASPVLLNNGNYVVRASYWNNGAITSAGAVRWCDGTAGCIGDTTGANSLIGSTNNDQVGSGGVFELSDGSYIVFSPKWDNGVMLDSGAVTWADDKGLTVGSVTEANSVLGTAASGGSKMVFDYDNLYFKLIVGRPADNKVTILALPLQKIFLPLLRR